MFEPLRVAVVGLGGLGRYHAECYRALADSRIVAVVDSSSEARDRAAAQFGVPAFASASALWPAPPQVSPAGRIDVVDVCTPTPFHHEAILAALNAGVGWIVCEKPLARTVAQAREIAAAARRTGATLFVGQVVRFFPEFIAAREAVERGDIGRPAIVRTSRRTLFPLAGWYANPEWSGGVIFDMLIHDFDWLCWCFGEVDHVYARSLTRSGVPRLDYALVTLRMASGVIAHVEGSWAHQRFSTAVEVAGDSGLLTFDGLDAAALRIQRRDDRPWVMPREAVMGSIPGGESPHFREIQHFVECIRQGLPPRVTVEDGLRAVEIATAAERSAATGRVVTIADVRER
ncbi:MAG: Gfo/Idh/MocA family oxidoreductase [Chloroflexi bacterium]|nr:Gfo/Idh/MocA family oxidoreductase [Chloroflexota bacterium]